MAERGNRDQVVVATKIGGGHGAVRNLRVDKANDALRGTEFDGTPVEEILANLSSLPADRQVVLRNNGGGHANHTLFWESMSPDGGGAPTSVLADAIVSAFGSFDSFKEQFEANGVGQFGSGWTWLVLDASKQKAPGRGTRGLCDPRRSAEAWPAAGRERTGASLLTRARRSSSARRVLRLLPPAYAVPREAQGEARPRGRRHPGGGPRRCP
jgi:Iron/manganese superoxide dismutases, C-terminal domain/Iron/manganese superoxide dismutases, alpha-hairpin domain